jgi:hypothetical protein
LNFLLAIFDQSFSFEAFFADLCPLTVVEDASPICQSFAQDGLYRLQVICQ